MIQGNQRQRIVRLEKYFYTDQELKQIFEWRAEVTRDQNVNIIMNMLSCDHDDAKGIVLLGVDPYTVVALKVLPLILVAWSDGKFVELESQNIENYYQSLMKAIGTD